MMKSYPLEYLQVIQRFRLLDDTFMTAVFDGDIEATQLVLRIILDKPDLIVVTSQAQHLLKNLQGRSSQLDIHAYDFTGQHSTLKFSMMTVVLIVREHVIIAASWMPTPLKVVSIRMLSLSRMSFLSPRMTL